MNIPGYIGNLARYAARPDSGIDTIGVPHHILQLVKEGKWKRD